MIEFFGLKLGAESVAFLAAFLLSEAVGSSRLKENSIAELIRSLVGSPRPSRACEEVDDLEEEDDVLDMLPAILERIDQRMARIEEKVDFIDARICGGSGRSDG